MNPAQLLAQFDHISDAPDAIPRLRRFILDLAVRGKLVEQDLRDEPSSEFLKRIQAKKVRLVSASEMKKEKPLPVIEEDEIPFAIPANWQWVRLNDITSYIQRGRSPKYATGEGLPVISQKCVQWGGLDLESAKRITRESIEDYEAIRFLRSGDLLWNSTGTGTIGRIIKVKEPSPKLVCDGHVTVVRCLEVDAEYIRSWLRSDHVYAVMEDRAAGSTNQVELTSQLAVNQVVPLPPLTEQHRIVAKLDELMALCDRLEGAQNGRENQRDRLAAASLHRLNNGADADAFRNHARFYFNNLPRLTTRREHISQLRQTIFNLAVRGKLVPQDPGDEPASELLKRIQAEKAQLVKEGKIKQKKPLLYISELEKRFVLPSGWEWVRMQSAFDVRDGTHDTPKYIEHGGVPLITSRNFVDGKISFDEAKLISRSDHDSIKKRSGVDRGDILYSMIGGNIGNQVLVDTDREFSIKNVALFKYYTRKESLPEYLNLFLKTVTIGLQDEAAGGAQPFVSLALLRNIPIPIPPLSEQHRIVAKVEELMALCGRLEAQLTTTQTESRRLLEAVLHDALVSAA